MSTFYFYFSTEITISIILLYFFCFYNFAKPVLISDLNKIIKILVWVFCLVLLSNISYLCVVEPTDPQLVLFTAVSFVKITKLTILWKLGTLCLSIIFLVLLLTTFKYYAFFQLEHVVLFLISMLGGLFLISANDFIFFYLSLEVFSMPLYILAASKVNSNYSTESGLKYYIASSTASALFLFGTSLIYLQTGSLDFETLKLNFLYSDFLSSVYQDKIGMRTPYTWLEFFGSICIMFSLFIKLGVPPFHLWMPAVYDGAPLIITIYFMLVTKFVLWGAFYSLSFLYFHYQMLSETIIMWSIISSFFFSIFPALNQIKLKKLLIYSGISTNAYCLIPLLSGNESSLFLFLIMYLITLSGIFAFLSQIRRGSDFESLDFIGGFLYYYRYNSILAFCVAGLFFSIIGLPPLSGFFFKYYLFLDIFPNKAGLIIIALTFGIISAVYYIRVISKLLLSIKPRLTVDELKQWNLPFYILPNSINIVYIIFVTLLVATGLFYFNPLLSIMEHYLYDTNIT